MRDRLLHKLAHLHSEHPWRMLTISLVITVIMLGLAGNLTVTMRTSDVLPEDDPKVAQFNKIIDEFSTATSMVIVVQGEEGRIKAFADDLAPRLLELKDTVNNDRYKNEIEALNAKLDQLSGKTGRESKTVELENQITDLEAAIDFPLYQRIDYKISREFIAEHGLMLIKAGDLENTSAMFTDPHLAALLTNLNNSLEKEYIGQEESISDREREDGAVNFLDGIQNLLVYLQKSVDGEELSAAEAQAVVDKLLFGEPYMLSYDKTALILNGIPAFTLMDRDLLMSCTIETQAAVDELLQAYPDILVGLSGSIAKEHDEQVYGTQTLGSSTLIAMLVILAMLIISFRMWLAPLLALLNLIVGIIWASGLAYLLVGQLNMMTSIFSIILFGLGIDFSIHLITGFTEWRAQGNSILMSLEKTFEKSGKGILTGGLTTALAFLALLISQSRGMKEMGIVIGEGLLSVLLTTLVFLPSMLVLHARRVDKRRARQSASAVVPYEMSFKFLGNLAQWMGRHYGRSIPFSVITSLILVISAFQIEWDYDYRSMEPEGLVSIALIDTVMDKFDLSMDYALVITDDVEESRRLAEEYRDLASVAITDDISQFLPSPPQQAERRQLVNEIHIQMMGAAVRNQVSRNEVKQIMTEVDRLGMNIIEMQDMAFIGGQDKVDNKCQLIVGDPDQPQAGNMISDILSSIDRNSASAAIRLGQFQGSFSPRYRDAVVKMSVVDPISFDQLPNWILDRYANKARDQFLITVYPSGSIYDGEFMNRFAADVERVSEKATGMASLMVAILEIFGRDGRYAIMLTMVIVLVLLLIDFRKFTVALLAFIPLVMGFFWMLGLMYLAKIPLNMMTVMGLPLIIGIGIDDGVHIIHRWVAEGPGRLRTIFASTGKAIFLTSLTTMFAFGSMVFSVFPAYGQFGGALFMGVAACFLTTVVILPGLIGWIEREKK